MVKCIELDMVIPGPLRECPKLDSEIWGTQLVFDEPAFYQVWAPSGRGKTTFAHIIYGLRRDYSGSVNIDGTAASAITANDWALLRQSHFSIVFQDLRLFPDLTARENIQLNRSLAPYLSDWEIRDLCKELSIVDLLDKPCGQMSFGERQRVAVIRAMAQPFEWLLLDEPFSHLDQRNADKVSSLIRQQCQQRGAGCLQMTLEQAQQLAPTAHTLRL
jgi:putative ABC transport system ATP-binding protein